MRLWYLWGPSEGFPKSSAALHWPIFTGHINDRSVVVGSEKLFGVVVYSTLIRIVKFMNQRFKSLLRNRFPY